MASRIKGITIEIGGDTTPLQKALKQVDSSLQTTQTNLKDINKLLKMDPGNTELLKQKQENLNQAIKDTNDRLKTLKDAYRQLDGKDSEEAKEQQKGLAREIAETESKLKSLKKEMSDFGSVAKQKLEAVGDSMKQVGDNISNVGKDLSMKLTAPIVAVGTIGVTYNAQLEQLNTLFTTLTGSAEEADRVISNIIEDASRSPFDTESLIKANQYLISAGIDADKARQTILDLGNAIAATGGGNDELDRMAMNLQQIKNVGKASAQDIKQFANAGINIYGLLAESMGKTVEQVKEMDVSYEVLADALSKASQEGGKYYGAMEAQSETMTGSINKLKASIKTLLGEITKAAMPVIKQVIAQIQNVVTWFSSLDDSQKEMILKIAAVVAAIGPALLIIGKVVSIVGTLVSKIGLLFSPMGAVITIIAAVVAAGVKLYQNWDTIKAKLLAFKDKWKQDWQQIKDFFAGVGKSIGDTLSNMVKQFSDKLSAIWTNVKNTFQNIGDWISKKLGFIVDLFGGMNWNLPNMGNGETYYGNNRPVLNLAHPSMTMPSQAAAVSEGTVINMTVNGGSVSANELADIVMDKLTNTIKRNNQRW